MNEKKQKVIGVLTSGGDAPGMNAAVRAVVRTAIKKNMQVMGIRRGYNGLINGDMSEMNIRSVSNVLHRGGTMLLTARCNEFKTEEGQMQAVGVCKELGIDGLVIIGGDGSFMGARALSLKGIPCIGIPGTIDNDIACTDYTIGFDTALNTAVEAIDRLRDTSESHDRCSVVEVMGHGAGHLALYASVACGGTACWVNEIGFDVDRDIIEKMNTTLRTGKHNFIIIVSEGITDVHRLARYIEEKTGVESRATVLGHIQRGGTPTATDRIVASRMGCYAIDLLEQGKAPREKQDDALSCYAPMLDKKIAKLDFAQPATKLHDLIRGLSPWPVAHTTFEGKLLKVHRAVVAQAQGDCGPAGKVLDSKKLIVACGSGALELQQVQLEGGKRISGEDFMRGRKAQQLGE